MELYNSEWYKSRDTQDLVRLLGRTDYSVIGSRRDAHTAINDFRNNAVRQPFDENSRFPSGFSEMYLTSHDTVVLNTIISLTSVLSYRSTNSAKDTDAGMGGKASTGKGDKDAVLAFDQGLQDNTKRFEELCKQLGGFLNYRDVLWTQKSFENRTSATWA